MAQEKTSWWQRLMGAKDTVVEATVDVAEAGVDKVGDVTEAVVDKAGDAKDVVVDVASDVVEGAGNTAIRTSGEPFVLGPSKARRYEEYST